MSCEIALYPRRINLTSRLSLQIPVAADVVGVGMGVKYSGECPAVSVQNLSDFSSCVFVVAAGDAKIDNPKYKAQFGTKAKMLTPDEAQAMIGHAVGGVCPFAVNDGVTVYLDVSLKRFQTVFPACGSSNSAIELTIAELEKYSGFTSWIDVCKGWNEVI